MTKQELIEKAESMGLTVPENATVKSIQELLKDAEAPSDIVKGEIFIFNGVESMLQSRPPFRIPDCEGVLSILKYDAGEFRGDSSWTGKQKTEFTIGDSLPMMLPTGMIQALINRAGDKPVLIDVESGKPSKVNELDDGTECTFNPAYKVRNKEGNLVWSFEK